MSTFTNVYPAQQLIQTLGKKQLSNPWETDVSLGKIQTLGLINNLNNSFKPWDKTALQKSKVQCQKVQYSTVQT